MGSVDGGSVVLVVECSIDVVFVWLLFVDVSLAMEGIIRVGAVAASRTYWQVAGDA